VRGQVEVIAEPGRYFAAECMTLAANIVSRRVKHR
jgi:diaminopimelate decarboxylase